jgi:hypothetical protein
MQREFPFSTRIGRRTVKVVGLHWSRRYYESEGAGLLPLSVKPMEPQESGPASVTSPKVWRRRGCFKSDPPTVDERNRRAERARNWLRKSLDGGLMPAAEILRLAKRQGIPARGFHRTKKWLNVRSVKVGGRR